VVAADGDDGGDVVVHRVVAAEGAGVRAAVEVGRGLNFVDVIGAGAEVIELVAAVGQGRGGGDDVVGGIEELDGDAAEAGFVGVDLAVLRVSTQTMPAMLTGSISQKS